jgi:predicted Abi (CAAX) family protease
VLQHAPRIEAHRPTLVLPRAWMVVVWVVVLAVAVALGVLIGFSLWGGTQAATLDVPRTLHQLRTTIGAGGFI